MTVYMMSASSNNYCNESCFLYFKGQHGNSEAEDTTVELLIEPLIRYRSPHMESSVVAALHSVLVNGSATKQREVIARDAGAEQREERGEHCCTSKEETDYRASGVMIINKIEKKI